MKNAVGIICEYNPFHTGHARQFALIREKLPDAAIVCLMSGCFTQRGMSALFSPAFRAEAALQARVRRWCWNCPAPTAVRDAENFALGRQCSIFDQACGLSPICHSVLKTPDLERVGPSRTGILENPDEAFQAAHCRTSLAAGQALRRRAGGRR